MDDLQRMVQVLRPMKRLTTTFRFEAGSIRLDAQSRSNVAQLAQEIEAGQYDGRRLMFVGFSDGEGLASANLGIALRRAEAVRTAVQTTAETASFDRLKLDVDAFGEAMPMACDDSAWGVRSIAGSRFGCSNHKSPWARKLSSRERPMIR